MECLSILRDRGTAAGLFDLFADRDSVASVRHSDKKWSEKARGLEWWSL
jgi:hypothetical protein